MTCKIAGFPGLDLYFPNPDVENVDKIKTVTSNFYNHIKRHQHLYAPEQIEKNRRFLLDYKVISGDGLLSAFWPDFRQEIHSNTEFNLRCASLAMYKHVIETTRQTDGGASNKKPPRVIRARLTSYEPVCSIKDINVNCLGKLVAIKGTVIKASSVKIICNYMAFYCHKCDSLHVVRQINGNYTPPPQCPTCRAKENLEAAYTSDKTRTVEWQTVLIQESGCDTARVPQSFECELTEDLVKSCLPGDDVTICGIVKHKDPNDNKGKNKQNSMFKLYLEAVALTNARDEKGESSLNSKQISFTPDDYATIRQIHGNPQLFRYLVNSLCPLIYGHEVVKAGLILALFGGTKADCSRSESHVLMVGDPGLGKSQLLRSCANVSPVGVYVCGTGSTTTGLTVSMIREKGGDYALEAGALMIADQGCCCIDEFDKMPSQHAGLLEAMEQQTISIAKAGMVCSMPTKTTVLAAANPVGGHYNKAKTVAENLKIGSPMLSRFDLIFIMLDKPNEHLDRYLSKHILAAHSSSKTGTLTGDQPDASQSDISLRSRLRPDSNEKIQPLPHSVLRKYIAYAQRYVHPHLSAGAKAILKEFYVTLRRRFATDDSTPITARQVQSLIRLTQARAKTELREEATEDDARDVIEIMEHSLDDIFTDERGVQDKSRSQMGSGMSNKNRMLKVLDILQKKSELEGKSLFSVREIKDASELAGLPVAKFPDVLRSLNIQNYLLRKGGNTYQLNSAYL